MKKNYLFAIVMIAALVLLTACGGGDSPDAAPPAPEAAPAADAQPAEEAAPAADAQPAEESAPAAEMDSEFPFPDDAKNIQEVVNGVITFQTELSLPDAITFYRFAFIGEGYVERELLTMVSDAAFSVVFDGHTNGKAIIVQGVNLGESVNITIHFEDL